MFQQACEIYRQVFCDFGGGSPTVQGKLHSTACLLSSRHVITAAHNVRQMEEKYSWPVVTKFDGLFKCQTAAIDDKIDIAVLRITEQLAESSLDKPARYPQLATNNLAMGMTVGYMTWLHKKSPSGRSQFLYFGTAHVSHLGESELGHPTWILDTGFVEAGFSGSPVFLPDCSLVGIMVGSNAFTQDLGRGGVPPIVHCFPQVSSVPNLPPPLAEDIRKATSI